MAGILRVFILTASACVLSPVAEGRDYAVVVSSATFGDAGWKNVVETLVRKHDAAVHVYTERPAEVLDVLQVGHPRYTCFVATPAEASRAFVAEVHQLTRRYDADPYTDTRWGILTGYDATAALAVAGHGEPLTVCKVAAGTEFALSLCTEGLWYDELVKGKLVRKLPGGKAEQLETPGDTTQALVETLNEYRPDLFITSGHATERDWMLGFSYRNGSFKSHAGELFGVDTLGQRFEIDSPNPKVYLPVGNCLMGHIDGLDAMALAWMKDAGVKQMIGYTVPTWYGYGGWGCLDYFVEQPGRYSFAEAFLANHHALIHRLESDPGNDRRGLLFDRDVIAFYGDPKWEARMAAAPCAYDQQLSVEASRYTLTIIPRKQAASFQPVNNNGSQRGWRPIVQFLPHRVRDARIVVGEDLCPVVLDDFLLIPNPHQCDPQREYRVVFEARRAARLDN